MGGINFYSTANRHYRVSFEQAVTEGIPPDGGLFMPEQIDPLPAEFWNGFSDRSFQKISYEIASHFLKGALPANELKEIVDHTVSFDAPLVEVEPDIFSLELFHGPTMAFKDFGARFLSGVLGYFSKYHHRGITILVATSGDTGSAVANGFLKVKGVNVIVLYPRGKVSDIQERQFTTLGSNITALEIDGTFDDCQRLVKSAFADAGLKNKLSLTSANSINIARLLPQTFYYFNAFAQLENKNLPVVFSVPSGNYGNLTAGLMAKRMGLPVHQFVAATNVNDIVPQYLRTKLFEPRPSLQTISNAMDVGNPSNFARMIDLYNDDFEKLSADVTGFSFTDSETKSTIQQINQSTNYVLDPHGAVAYLGLKEYLKSHNKVTGVFLETAHPGKFKETVEPALGKEIELPEKLMRFMKGEKQSLQMSNRVEDFKQYLTDVGRGSQAPANF